MLIFFLLVLVSGDPPVSFQEHRRLGVQAYRAGDHTSFKRHMEAALLMRPDHVGVRYNTAIACALTGDGDRAVAELKHLAKQGLVFDISDEKHFAAVHRHKEYALLKALFDENLKPVGTGKTAFVIRQKDFFPEGITYDPQTKLFFVGSVHHRSILAIDATGKTKTFVPEKSNGIWSVMGMAVDQRRRILWACSSAIPQTKELVAGEKGGAGLFGFNLDTGTPIGKYTLTVEGEEHNWGDLALAEDGTVYLSDGVFAALYVVRPGSEKPELLLKSDRFHSPQGLCLSDDARYLYIADYGNGLFRMDLNSLELIKAAIPADIAAIGVDGLTRNGDSLIAIQNGIRPHRVVRWQLNGSGDAVTAAEVLEANNPIFDEPTLGTVAGGAYYFVATSQWGAYTKEHLPLPAEKLKEITIMKIDLTPEPVRR